MNTKIDLDAPIKTIIVKILSYDPEINSIFGRTKKEDLFFQDLLTVGCDFYELLELFANNEAINKKSVTCIFENIPGTEKISDFSDKELRKMIPHWSPSRYHTASIEDVCKEVKQHLTDNSSGTYIYNSNLNNKNRRAYNDAYILLIANDKKYFFDINRKKAFYLCDNGDDVS